jgi:hypothetical protein
MRLLCSTKTTFAFLLALMLAGGVNAQALRKREEEDAVVAVNDKINDVENDSPSLELTLGQVQIDYDVDPKDKGEDHHLLVQGYWDPEEKIAMCFGDCDSDFDCEDGLFCFHRDLDNMMEQEVPGCSEDDNYHLNTTNSVCVSELPPGYQDPTMITLKGTRRRRTTTNTRKLMGECGGDCDSNGDCNGNLVCYQRGRGDPVPGCPNKNLGTTRDYCVVPSKIGNSRNKLGLCEGDCDTNSDCESGLVCHQREAYEPIPNGCRGSLRWSTDLCVRPGSGRVPDTQSNKLGLCGGDCDSDNDCRSGLVCHQREANEPFPEGCEGDSSRWSTDYCVRPGSDRVADTGSNNDVAVSNPLGTVSSGPFRLRIYWEPGYDWQGSYTEKFCK